MPVFLAKLLDQITMYRLMFYFLLGLFFLTTILSMTRVLSYDPLDIYLSGIYFLTICNLSNYLFSKLFKTKINFESASITALILTLIVGPSNFFNSIQILTFIALTAMLSKYVLTLRKKHVFNPAAIGVFLSAVIFNTGASWWIGSIFTLPFILIGGFLILVKIKRLEIVLSFLTVFLVGLILDQNFSIRPLLDSPIWFFVFVMLIEPLTSPLTRRSQIIFGGFTAILYFVLPRLIPSYPYGLETSLLIANLLTLILSPTSNVMQRFIKKEKIAKDTWTFYFEPLNKFKFIPGQYLEWTFPHKNSDSRGTRRYFTVSSAPEEEFTTITIKTTKKGSSFKSELLKIAPEDQVATSGLYGEFTLPKDKNIPLAFVAGGIGVTPFRSMINHLLETGEKRDIVMFYSNNTHEHIAFRELFDKAKSEGVKTIYVISKRGERIDEKMIKEKLPDYNKRVFYISGSQSFVDTFKKLLSKMGVVNIKTDFFPGYATAQP